MRENKDKKDRLQWVPVVLLLALVCDFLWGSAFPCIKLGYSYLEIESADIAAQILFAGTRFTLAGIMVIMVNCIRAGKFVYPASWKSWERTLALSSFQTVLQYLLFYIGLAKTTGVKASIIEAANVFICIFVTSLVFRLEKLTMQKLLGSLIGFAGIVVINLQGLQLDFHTGDVLIFISTFCAAMSSVLLKKFADEEDTVLLSGYQFFVGGVVLSIVGILGGGKLDHLTLPGMGMLVYLAFISAMAYSVWAVLLAHNPVSRIAVLGFLNPVCGVILSAFLLGETQHAFGVRSLLALLLVSLGIFVVYRKSACE